MSNMAFAHEATTEFSKITENIYLGSSMCCKQHEGYHWESLKGLDIFCDIDIRLEHDESPHSIPVHIKLPVRDTFPPTLEQTKIAVDAIENTVNMGRNVYIHCQIAHGRSPTLVIAYFMMKKDMSFDEAFSFVKEKRPEIHPTDRQLAFLKTLKK